MSGLPQGPASRRVDTAGVVIALALAALAAVLVWDASQLQSNNPYGMGPHVMPVVIAVGLGILAIGNLIEALRGNLPARESADPKAVWLILGGLALLIAIIGLGGGFILATTALFVTTSRAFGRRAVLADLAIALVLTSLIYFAFDRLLTLSLPAGPLERLLMIDTFAALAHGMAVAVQPMNLLYALIGVLLGTAVGVLPGIGPALTVALLLPVTYKLDPGGSLIMFAGIYYGGMYGGSTTAILINTPGESASMATALEGNKMAKAGRGGPALATAAIGSFVAGTIATIGLAFLAPWLVDFAVHFGPEDYFALMCVAFVTVSATFGDSPIRGLTSLFIGLTLGLIGIDKLTGQARLAFGIPELLDGVEVTTLAVGLFAVGEALYVVSRRHHSEEKLEPVRGSLWMTKEDWKRSWKPWLRGTAFGFPIGALPAGGAEIQPFCLIRPRSASQNIRRNLARAPSKASPGRKRPTMRPPPARLCPC